FLGGALTYLLARRALRFGPWAALSAGVVFAQGGFLGAQTEHVNQLATLVWVPLVMYLFYLSYERRRLRYALPAAVVIAVQFLAGHAQSSYIALVVLACYAAYLPLAEREGVIPTPLLSPVTIRRITLGLGLFAMIVALGAGLAAFQLLPTYELSRLSIRGAGLSYRQAVSFSLQPGMLPRSLLPSFGNTPFSEYVAYTGIIPLLLALLGVWRRGRKQQAPFFIALSALGLLLALGVYNPLYYVLYRVLPGFGLFRAPARWLYLYALGMAVLAGLGVEELASLSRAASMSWKRVGVGALSGILFALVLVFSKLTTPRIALAWLATGLIGGAIIWLGLRRQRGPRYLGLLSGLIILELLVASRYLAYNETTAPEAFSSLRTSVAHLLTDDSLNRVLSFSDGTFDPGDLDQIEDTLAGQLSEQEVYDYIVATKQKEIVTPNLPLLYGLQSIDGYDGGVLPLARYVEWQRLLLPEEQVSVDGRLQGRITEIPPGRVLNLLNVKYVLTDKAYDVWVDGAYYDLGHRAVLGPEGPSELVVDDIPDFGATALGVVSYLVGGSDLAQGDPVAEITITDHEGRKRLFTLRAGEDTAEGEYQGAQARHQQARIVGHWRGNPAGNDYHAVLQWQEAIYPRSITVRFLAAEGRLRVRGLTLLDQRTGTHRALVVSTEGRYRLVHSGDVKIYENLDVLPRAFIVHQARAIEDGEQAISVVRAESFAPDAEVILSGDQPGPVSQPEDGEDEVSVLTYEPEGVLVDASLDSPGYLVLTDTYYPGWRARVDGQDAEVLRADYYFRAVYLPEGEHVVQFIYDPASFKVGLAVSLMCGLLVGGALAWDRRRR
ncbi:MAG: YfhO family protein, partial [Promethearchaeota archaeon]